MQTIDECINERDPISLKDLKNLSPNEQLELYKVRSLVVQGKYFCFGKRDLDAYYASHRDQDKVADAFLNPLTKTPFEKDILGVLESQYQATKRQKANMAQKMGVASCKEIREQLEKTTMTDEEKIVFIEQNRSSGKGLRSYIAKQHMNAADAKFFTEAGKTIMLIIGNQTKDIQDMVIDQPLDQTDPDCKYLEEVLASLYAKKTASAPSAGSKTLWASAMENLKNTTGKLIDGMQWVGGKLWNAAVFLGQWAASKAFQLGTWLMQNPKTAYFALMFLKGLKTRLCREAGKNLGYYGSDTNKEWMLGMIQKRYPQYVPPPNTLMQDAQEMLKDYAKPVVTETVAKVGSAIVTNLWAKSGDILKQGLSKAVKDIPIVGGFLSAASEVVITAAVDGSKEEIEMAIEQAAYATHVNNAFSALLDLVNPMKCMDDVMREFTKALSQSQASAKPLASTAG